MSNPFSHFWLFVYAVGDHAVTLAAGCVLTVVINLIEKYAMGGKRLPLKADIAILLVFVLFACFQAWRDQYEKVNNVPPSTTIQVNVPPINVPPAQVTIAPPATTHGSSFSRDLTGFLEVAGVKIMTATVSNGLPISTNVGFIVKGTQPIHGLYSAQSAILINYGKPLDQEVERSAEREGREVFKKEIAKQKLMISQQQIPGQTLGVGNVMMFRTVKTGPLDEKQVDGIVTGQTRMYLMTWAIWKDSRNQDGTLDTCQWMQAPSSTDLSKQQIVWHLCVWAP